MGSAAGLHVPAEIKLKHVRGGRGDRPAGRSGQPDQGLERSQFFIDVADLKSLDDGGYTVFGNVISGMDAWTKIVAFSNDATLPAAGGGGRNPGVKAADHEGIPRAVLEVDKPVTEEKAAEAKPADEK